MFYPYLCICCYASFVRERIASTLPSGQPNDISVVSFPSTRRYRPRTSWRVDCCRALAQSLTVCKTRDTKTRTSTHCLAVHIHPFAWAWGWRAVSYGSRETSHCIGEDGDLGQSRIAILSHYLRNFMLVGSVDAVMNWNNTYSQLWWCQRISQA